MGLTITPGPLPENNTSADASAFVENYVQNTEIANLGPDAFRGADITFVTSQSEAPSDPEQGWLWFKRGEGVLYLYVISSMTLGGAAVTEAGWLAVGGRREYHVVAVGPADIGQALTPASSDSSTALDFGPAALGGRYPLTPFIATHDATNFAGLPILIATESRDSGTIIPVTEIGYIDALIATDQTSTPGQAQASELPTDMGYTYIQAETNPTEPLDTGWMYFGHVVQSAPTDTFTRRIFKKYRPTAWISKVPS